jgi:isoleucyl-tRNA synthetase
VSEERINKVAETYRGIRNTLRYQLSNLYDFDPAKHTISDDQLTGLDRWIVAQFADLEAQVLEAYDKFEFHVVYQKVSQFVAVELSSIYHDVVKDRLYTDPANSHRRRSTQTALYRLVTGLCKVLSPILVFTSDEAWEFVPGKPEKFVHLATIQPTILARSAAEVETWKALFELREKALPKLEEARQAKTIGKALEAKLTISNVASGVGAAREDLRELLNVSQLQADAGSGELTFVVGRADGQKCDRCWHFETDIGQHANHPTLCGRCVEAVNQMPQ